MMKIHIRRQLKIGREKKHKNYILWRKTKSLIFKLSPGLCDNIPNLLKKKEKCYQVFYTPAMQKYYLIKNTTNK